MLDAAVRANLFVLPVDDRRGWWRLHPYLRDVLVRELMEREPERITELNRRAAAWFLGHGELEQALPYAQAGGDAQAAADILARDGLAMYERGQASALERALERFARDCGRDADAAVAVVGAFAHALRGHRYESLRWLAAADAAPERELPDGTSSPGAVVAVLHAIVSADGIEDTQRALDVSLRVLAPDSPWRPIAQLVVGALAVLAGDDDLAARALAAVGDGATVPIRPLALAERALLAFEAGDAGTALRLALEGRDLLAASPARDYAAGALVHAVAARAFLCQGRWDDARVELEAADALVNALGDGVPWLALQTRLALAAAYAALRNRDAAAGELAEARTLQARHATLAAVARRLEQLEATVDELPRPLNGHGTGLTRAELRVLPLLATHLSFREIGVRLFVSRNTVKTQAISIYRKLGVSSRSEAIDRAAELGLTTPTPPDVGLRTV
jgi:LuxR family maltose regulon positive regulatory protein